MSQAPFAIRPDITAVAVAYKNGAMIADQVLPRIPVGSQQFEYTKYPASEYFTLPETRVGRKSAPNQVEFSGSRTPDVTVDHALDDAIPLADIENARNQPGVPDPELRAGSALSKLIVLAREKRAADLVFDPNQYGAGNKVTLSGTSQWSDYVNSNPQSAVMDALDVMIMRANIGIFGRAGWTKFSQHPKICKAVFGNNTDAGIVTRRQVADLLELDDILVGEGWVNTAKKGQPANLVRVWGKHAAFLCRDIDADVDGMTTFGFTAQWGGRVGSTYFDPKVGMRGGNVVRVGESVKELVTANDLGYFFQNIVA
ncbi:MAG: phage capsid protein [Methylibium sp.]